ncbi:hypothetical protein P7K49_008252 [Saguinus oedipus]|uniref:Uncharacterized protein n=1 Tax=Saguinus oedipus TaxID=9490 RepID=A0ABQ9VX75_SAGOE|nr:hypothetical protein P7K49_008252 [Saguinus oedipus]
MLVFDHPGAKNLVGLWDVEPKLAGNPECRRLKHHFSSRFLGGELLISKLSHPGPQSSRTAFRLRGSEIDPYSSPQHKVKPIQKIPGVIAEAQERHLRKKKECDKSSCLLEECCIIGKGTTHRGCKVHCSKQMGPLVSLIGSAALVRAELRETRTERDHDHDHVLKDYDQENRGQATPATEAFKTDTERIHRKPARPVCLPLPQGAHASFPCTGSEKRGDTDPGREHEP